jgi:hypothetical protein
MRNVKISVFFASNMVHSTTPSADVPIVQVLADDLRPTSSDSHMSWANLTEIIIKSN